MKIEVESYKEHDTASIIRYPWWHKKEMTAIIEQKQHWEKSGRLRKELSTAKLEE